jgi:hypothetical protein
MKLMILGTDHALQHSDADLKECVATLVESAQITLIGEEFTPNGVAHQVADSKGIKWVRIDMSQQERDDAGIGELWSRRSAYRAAKGLPDEIPIYAPTEDGIREYFWLDRIADQQVDGIALLICGALHARKVSEKAQQQGHDTTLLFHPEMPGSQFWESIMPELL